MRAELAGKKWSFIGRVIAAGVALPFTLLGCSSAAQLPTQPVAQQKFLGNVWSPAQLQDFTRYWDQVTPENAGKWGPMEPQPGQFNWEPLDQAYALAKTNGFVFRFHVLVWGNQQPSWVPALTRDEQMAAIRRRWSAIAERYPAIDYIEVVNEPLHDPPRARDATDLSSGDYIEALGGDGRTGWDWIVTAFRMAREYFPDTELVLNDYNIVNSPEATDRYLEIVRLLQAEDLLDVIAVQAHAFTTTAESAVIRENVDRLAATGLPIMVTELDIDGPTDEVQLAEYQRIFPIFWDHPSVIGVTLWGWRPGLWRGRQGANLVRQDGTHRPAFEWLLRYTGRDRQQGGPSPEAAMKIPFRRYGLDRPALIDQARERRGYLDAAR